MKYPILLYFILVCSPKSHPHDNLIEIVKISIDNVIGVTYARDYIKFLVIYKFGKCKWEIIKVFQG